MSRFRVSELFIAVSAIGVLEAVYHAYLENAFVTNPFEVNYSVYASFLGVPYWVFGVVWFPLMLILGFWSTGRGTARLRPALLILLTVGNLFTVYLWYLDLDVIKAYTATYVALYATNYILSGLVVLQNWSNDLIRGFIYGTIVGLAVGGAFEVLLGPFAVAAFAAGGGILGAARNFALTND